jgi:hypothetical protein
LGDSLFPRGFILGKSTLSRGLHTGEILFLRMGSILGSPTFSERLHLGGFTFSERLHPGEIHVLGGAHLSRMTPFLSFTSLLPYLHYNISTPLEGFYLQLSFQAIHTLS